MLCTALHGALALGVQLPGAWKKFLNCAPSLEAEAQLHLWSAAVGFELPFEKLAPK